jgi:hypothetical protein
MKTLLFLVSLSFCGTVAQASAPADSLWKRGVSYEIGFQEMYSTHSNFFHGLDIGAGYRFSPKFRLGGGVEYSFNNYHDDNDWVLTNLRFVPIYIDQQISLRQKGSFRPFVRFRQGITPTSYLKKDIGVTTAPFKVREAGLYLYGSVGFTQRVSPQIGLFGEAGLKGFQMSFNSLEVNPHGATFRMGLQFAR